MHERCMGDAWEIHGRYMDMDMDMGYGVLHTWRASRVRPVLAHPTDAGDAIDGERRAVPAIRHVVRLARHPVGISLGRTWLGLGLGSGSGSRSGF